MSKIDKFKLTIKMKDGSILKEVDIFKDKDMGNNGVNSVLEIEALLQKDKTIYFGGKHIQGWLNPVNIERYEYVTIYE